MPRKPKQKRPAWTPNDDCAAAYQRAIDTAHFSAAVLFGEKPADDPRNASFQALSLAMGMLYFLCRLDPNDLRALSTGPGSFADWDHKPFPPGYRNRTPILVGNVD